MYPSIVTHPRAPLFGRPKRNERAGLRGNAINRAFDRVITRPDVRRDACEDRPRTRRRIAYRRVGSASIAFNMNVVRSCDQRAGEAEYLALLAPTPKWSIKKADRRTGMAAFAIGSRQYVSRLPLKHGRYGQPLRPQSRSSSLHFHRTRRPEGGNSKARCSLPAALGCSFAPVSRFYELRRPIPGVQ